MGSDKRETTQEGVKWICNARPGDMTSTMELSNRLQLNIKRVCLQDTRLLWSDYLERIGELT